MKNLVNALTPQQHCFSYSAWISIITVERLKKPGWNKISALNFHSIRFAFQRHWNQINEVEKEENTKLIIGWIIIEFLDEQPTYFIYILAVYERITNKIMKMWHSKNFEGKSPPFGFRGLFGLPLGSTARSHSLWDPSGLAPSVHAIYTNSTNYTWSAQAVGSVQWADRKTGQSDTRHVTVHQSTTHCNIVKVSWHDIKHS